MLLKKLISISIDSHTPELKRRKMTSYECTKLGSEYQNDGNFPLAIEQFSKGLNNTDDTNCQILLLKQRGVSYYKFGDTQNAINDFSTALNKIEHLPNDLIKTELYYYRGLSYLNANQFNQSIHDFTIFLNRSLDAEKKSEILYNRAYAYSSIQRFVDSLCDYSSLIDSTVNVRSKAEFLSIIYSQRGILHFELCDYTAAICDFNSAIELTQSSNDYRLSFLHYYRGLSYDHFSDKQNDAINDLTYVIRSESDFNLLILSLNYRGIIHSSQQNFNLAVADFSEALQRLPQNYNQTYRIIGINKVIAKSNMY